MKKRFFGTLLAAALVVTQVVSVFAAGSRTTQVTLVGEAAGKYEVSEGTAETFSYLHESAPEVETKILAVNSGEATLQSIAEQAPELAKELEGKSLITKFFDLEPINGGIRTEDGKYKVTLSVPALTETLTNVRLLHYSTERNLWEIVTPTDVNYKNKQITAEFIDLSPVAVIADVDESRTEGNDTTGSGTSPKTGVSSDWGMYMGAAVLLLGTAVVVMRKTKKECN